MISVLPPPVELEAPPNSPALRRLLDEQSRQILKLAGQVERLSLDQAALQAELAQARAALLERQDALQAAVYDGQAAGWPGEKPDAASYRQLIRRARELVRAAVPRGALVLVVSKGDPALLDLYGRPARHFPQTAAGAYAGAYPAGSLAACLHLEALRARGADYLLFPATAEWWLEHYAEFRQHLERRYRLAASEPGAGRLYSLRELPAAGAARALADLEQLADEFDGQFDREPAVLDWDSGLGLSEQFPQRVIFSPWGGAKVLPHLDRSVDIVVAGPGPARAAEARGVAASAAARVTERGLEITWQASSDAPPLPRTGIVIPAYEHLDCGTHCLTAWLESYGSGLGGEIWIGDDDRLDIEAIVSLQQRWDASGIRLRLAPRGPGGVPANCNRAAALAGCDVLVFLTAPVAPAPGWLPPLLRMFRRHPEADLVCGKLAHLDGRLAAAGGVLFRDGTLAGLGQGEFDLEARLFNYARPVPVCPPGLLAARRDAFLDAGGFDEVYRTADYALADLCLRAARRGRRILYQPASVSILLRDSVPAPDAPADHRLALGDHARFARRWRQALAALPDRPASFDRAAWHALAVDGGG
jgi:hypothetical protein